jgi:hypothetical protein
MHVPVPAAVLGERNRWRISFGFFAAEEEGEPLRASLDGRGLRVDHPSGSEILEPDAFVAWLTNRPQQLADASARRVVARLLS